MRIRRKNKSYRNNMAHDKIQYWKERMQDNLHTFDTAFTALQKDILDKSTHLGLDRTDIVKALNAIRKDENRVEVEKAILAVTGFSVRAQFDFLDAFQVKKDKSDEGESSLEALKIALGEYADKLEVIE